MKKSLKSKLSAILIAVAGIFSMGLTACASTKVSRVDAEKVIDLDGYWNDADIRIVCNQMIKECIQAPRVQKFEDQNGRAPIVVVGKIKNESSERIDTSIVAKRLQTAILNSGVMEFVASADERDELDEELIYQDQHANVEQAKTMDNSDAADFMLTGSVKTQVQKDGNTSVRTYFVYITLTDVETHRIIWQGENDEIKKVIKSKKAKF